MQVFQQDIESILFVERSPPPNLAQGVAHDVNKAFWSDPYAKNLRLDDVEVEVRLGRVQERFFETGVSLRSFQKLMSALQDYPDWDEQSSRRETVIYFETRDDSLRAIMQSDGSMQYMSKQKAFTSDYTINNAPYDLRLSASIEMPVADRPALETSTRRVVRDRVSYTLGKWRYDLSTVTPEGGGSSVYHVEIELVNATQAQVQYNDATEATEELGCRVRDLLKILEPDIPKLTLRRRRRKWH